MPEAQHTAGVAGVQCAQKRGCWIDPWRSGWCDRALHSARISISQGAGDAEYFSSFCQSPESNTHDRATALMESHLAPIDRRLAGRTALEAAMLPEVLLRNSTDRTFDQPVDTCGILHHFTRRKELERRPDFNVIAGSIGSSSIKAGYHRGTADLRQSRRGRQGRGLYTEKRGEDAALGACIDIRGIPHHLVPG